MFKSPLKRLKKYFGRGKFSLVWSFSNQNDTSNGIIQGEVRDKGKQKINSSKDISLGDLQNTSRQDTQQKITTLDKQYIAAELVILDQLKLHYLKLLRDVYLRQIHGKNFKSDEAAQEDRNRFKELSAGKLQAELETYYKEHNNELEAVKKKKKKLLEFIGYIKTSEESIKSYSGGSSNAYFSQQPKLWQNTSRSFAASIKHVDGKANKEIDTKIHDEMESCLRKIKKNMPLFAKYKSVYRESKTYLAHAKRSHKANRKEAKRRLWYYAKNDSYQQLLDKLPKKIKETKVRRWLGMKEDSETIEKRVNELKNLKGFHDTGADDGPINEELETTYDALGYHSKAHALEKDILKLIKEYELENASQNEFTENSDSGTSNAENSQENNLEEKRKEYKKILNQATESTKRWLDPYYKYPKRQTKWDYLRWGVKFGCWLGAAACAAATLALMFGPGTQPIALITLFGMLGFVGLEPLLDTLVASGINKFVYHRNSVTAQTLEMSVGTSLVGMIFGGVFVTPSFLALGHASVSTMANFHHGTQIGLNGAAGGLNTGIATGFSAKMIMNKLTGGVETELTKPVVSASHAWQEYTDKRLHYTAGNQWTKMHHPEMFIYQKPANSTQNENVGEDREEQEKLELAQKNTVAPQPDTIIKSKRSYRSEIAKNPFSTMNNIRLFLQYPTDAKGLRKNMLTLRQNQNTYCNLAANASFAERSKALDDITSSINAIQGDSPSENHKGLASLASLVKREKAAISKINSANPNNCREESASCSDYESSDDESNDSMNNLTPTNGTTNKKPAFILARS